MNSLEWHQNWHNTAHKPAPIIDVDRSYNSWRPIVYARHDQNWPPGNKTDYLPPGFRIPGNTAEFAANVNHGALPLLGDTAWAATTRLINSYRSCLVLLTSHHPPWAAALLHGDQDAALDLLARAPIPSQRPDTEHPAVFAARMNAPRVVAHFIQTGQVDATDLLRHVPANTHAETYRSILEHGADPNARNSNGFSILQWACEERNVELAHLLLSHGADVRAFDHWPHVRSIYAEDRGWVSDYQAGGVVKAFAGMGRDPAEMAPLLREVIALGADVDLADTLGQTGLFVHCMGEMGRAQTSPYDRFGRLDVVRVLLESRASLATPRRLAGGLPAPDQPGRLYGCPESGSILWLYALRRGYFELCNLLRDHGVRVPQADEELEETIDLVNGNWNPQRMLDWPTHVAVEPYVDFTGPMFDHLGGSILQYLTECVAPPMSCLHRRFSRQW